DGETLDAYRNAIYGYNHAWWYVDDVMDYARRYARSLEAAGGVAGQAIVWATAQVGTYYRWGGTCTDPRLPGDIPDGQRDGNNSWVHNCDCSSLLRAAYEYAGVTIGGYTGDQVRDGVQVSLDDVQPGDLIFSSSMQAPGVPSHVVMYIGSGQYVHSPATGRTVEISDSGWYLMPENVSQVRRVAGAG